MNWSSVAIFLALLFATACSQRGGRRYVADQPLEESLAVDNHRFQTRSRVDVEDARRGEGRRTRIQETTETNSRIVKGRSRINNEEPRQFRSRTGKEQESKPSETRQFASRRSLETDPSSSSSHKGTRNERFRSRESSATTDGTSEVKNFRSRGRVEETTAEYRSRGTETKRFPSRVAQEQEASKDSKDSNRLNVGERRGSRHRSQTKGKNSIETPKNIETVTEGFVSRPPLREKIQRSELKEPTEKFIQNYQNLPITEGKVPDLTSASNEIEIEKRTSQMDSFVTEKLHSRKVGQVSREGTRRSRVDPSTEKNYYSLRDGREKTTELQTRGAGLESRRRSRPADVSVTERFPSRQLSRDDYSSKRGRINPSTDRIRSDNGNEHVLRGRKGHELTSRGSGTEFEKRRKTDTSSTERFHSRESDREKLLSRIEPTTSADIETKVNPELSNKEISTVETENKIQTESVEVKPTSEATIDALKPITNQPDPLSTENTVDFPIKSNDVEEPNRTSRKLDFDISERTNQNQHRGLNHDFENSKRGKLESTLSRERSRSQESLSRDTNEGRRSSRRFRTQSPDPSKETVNESKSRRTQQRLPSRTRNAGISRERGRQNPDGEGRNIAVRHRNESPVVRTRNNERIPQSALGPEPITENRVENKVLVETEIQNEQKNEVTSEPVRTQLASTQRAPSTVSQNPGKRGRGSVKGANVLKEKEHSGEVKDEDNYPEVYKQLKKSGTDPKEILALLKARKAVREKLEKTNSKISQPDTFLNPSQRPVFGSDEIKQPLLRGKTVSNSNLRSRDRNSEEINQITESKIVINEETRNSVSTTEKIERLSNFRSNRFKTQKTFHQKSDLPITAKTTHESTTEEKLLQDEALKEKKYNPYNYKEIRSFNRKNLPERSKNYRNTVKSLENNEGQKLEDKNTNNEFNANENQEPVNGKKEKSFTTSGNTRFRRPLKNYNNPSLKKEEIISQNNDAGEIINEDSLPKPERPSISRLRSTSKNSNGKMRNDEEEELKQNYETYDTIENKKSNTEIKFSSEEEKESNSQSSLAKVTSVRSRKFGSTVSDKNKFRKKFNTKPEEKPESELIKPLRRTSFTNPGINEFKSRKENDIESSSPEVNTEKTNTRSNYTPRNRESDFRKFKARTEKTLEDTSVEPLIIRNYNLFNRNEHSFRRRSFTSPASEGTEMFTTVQYKNSMAAVRSRPPFVPQRKKFVKTTTLDPLPISRFKARKASLSKLFNEEVLKVDNSEDHTLTFNFKEEDDLRPNIDDLSIDSLVSESEHSSITTEISPQKQLKYTESHIQKVPPKRRGSEYSKLTTSSTTSKSEVYTVLAVPYEESTSAPETTISTEFVLDPTTQSTTISDIIPSTTPISTTDHASSSFSTTETPSTTTVTTTEISLSNTLSTSEVTTIKTTTTEPTTIKTTADSITTKVTTEPSTISTTTETMTTISTTATQSPTTITTTTTTTTTMRPTTTKTTTTTTKPPTTTKRLSTTKSTTKRPTTTKSTTKRPTTTKSTTKRPTTTKPTTTKRPTTTKQPTTTKTTTKQTTTTKTTTTQPTTTTKQSTTTTNTTKRSPTTTKTTIVPITTRPTTKRPSSTTKSTTKKAVGSSTKMPTTKKTTHKPTTRATTFKTTEKPSSTTITTHSNPVSSTQKASHPTTTFKIDELLSTTHPNFLSTIAYLARNLTVTPTLYENANTANFKSPLIPTENTTPMQNQSAMKNDYFVYGLLPNNNVVRKVVKTTVSPMDVPFYIYGLYPNGTIVRRFPNGTIVPDETEEENEVIGRIEPGSEESLETVVKKDNPLSYLYPPGYEKTTTQAALVSTTTTTRQAESYSEVIPIDPRVAPVSSIEKPVISIKDTDSNSGPTTVQSTTKFTTAKPQTKSTTSKSTTKMTTTKPPIKATVKTPTKPPTKSATTKSTTKLTTVKPVTKQVTKSTNATTQKTNIKLTTKAAVAKVTNIKLTTAKPTIKITTTKPVTTKSTPKPTSTKPTPKPTSAKPIVKTTTSKPTSKTTSKPSLRPTTKPTTNATITKSTPKIITNKPIKKSTSATTIKPTSAATTKSTLKITPKTKTPVSTPNKLITSTSTPPLKAPTTKTTTKAQEKSTIKTITTPLSDAELLNNLLSQDVKEIIPKGTAESTVALADKVIQLAIERAQKSSTAPSVFSPEDLQSLSTTSTPIQKQSLGGKHKEESNKLTDDSNTNKTGKISVWVIPPDESTTSKLNIGASKSEVELLNALLSSPSTIENLSLSDQLLLADIISSTAAPPTTRKKKKKSRTTTTTTTPPPPAFPILQYLFGRNRGGGGGLFQRGLFRGGGLRNLETATTSPQNEGGIFQNDGLPQGQGELAAESQEDPQQGGGPGLVSAAINVSRAVSQFMGFVIQGAAQSFQNYLQTRTRALANALTYPPAS